MMVVVNLLPDLEDFFLHDELVLGVPELPCGV